MANSSAYELREAEIEDWAGIATLIGRPASKGRDLLRWVQREHDSWVAWVAIRSADSLQSGVAGAVVAGLSRGRPAGYGEGAAGGDREGRIVWLGVAAPHRRRGLGTELLDRALDELRRRQASHATVLVDGTQVEALALFRKGGFIQEGQTLGLLLPSPAAAALAGSIPPSVTRIRALRLDEVTLLAGLLIQLGLERAEDPHDDLEALTPSQVEHWLQRPGTVGYAAWEAEDAQTPLGLAWATRRPEDGLLRFIGVRNDMRRHGVGKALLASVVEGLAMRSTEGEAGGGSETGRYRPLRVQLSDPRDEQEFFRRLGFEAERVTFRMVRALSR
jgi:ribosomal protein S18 acetylase RimI-like enzyme